MKKLISLLVLVAVALSGIAQEKPKLAVYMTGDDPVNEIVANRLVDDFARGNQYITMERTSSFLAELNKEHAYERSGEVDDDQIAALGKQFKVQYVCVASVHDVWESEKYISARIIDVETAEVVASGSSNGSITNPEELKSALNSLSSNFLEAMDNYKNSDAKKVAVYVSKTGNRDVDIVLGDQMVAGFAKSGRYLAIERTNSFLNKLKDEQGYQQSGSVDDSDLTKWGLQFGVKYVCVLKTTAWSGAYYVSARMIDVVTGEVVNSYKIEGRRLANSQDVVVTAQEIAANLSKGTFAEQAELKAQGLVDLGLPSGTLWKIDNEEGFYTYGQAVSRFGSKLPTKGQWEELKNSCTWTWQGNGYKVVGPNGNSIFLPAAGYRACDGSVNIVGYHGGYWSSTPNGSDGDWYLTFNSGRVYMYSYQRCDGNSVRLVQ